MLFSACSFKECEVFFQEDKYHIRAEMSMSKYLTYLIMSSTSTMNYGHDNKVRTNAEDMLYQAVVNTTPDATENNLK